MCLCVYVSMCLCVYVSMSPSPWLPVVRLVRLQTVKFRSVRYSTARISDQVPNYSQYIPGVFLFLFHPVEDSHSLQSGA
jgi:hypothetical protein